ncbi:MAG TPA: hypothetical protein VFO83_17035 [Aggregicoccus sp.]|nr:hypothetical protein [Aggregicoccus sp.]
MQPGAAAPASSTVFDEPTRVGVLSSEELARLGLSAPPLPQAPPRPARAAPPPVPQPRAAPPLPPPRRTAAGAPHPGVASEVAEALRRAASPTPPPAGAVALSPSQRPAPAAPAPASGLDSEALFGGFGDLGLPAAPAAPPAAPSLLGDLEEAEAALIESGERAIVPSGAELEDARARFELPRREVLPPLPAAEPALELAAPQAQHAPAAPIPRPAGRPDDVGMPEPRRNLRRTRQLLGLLANLAVAAALVLGLALVGRAYLREEAPGPGALSPSRLRELLLPAAQPLPLEDVSNGLYDTRDGGPVFYVRGEVVNRTQRPTRVRVRAALYDGEQRVKGVEGLAGAAASPEQLHALGSAEEVLALRRRLDAQARVLAPGERAPFVLVFFEYPPELGAFRLELVSSAEAP